MNFLLEFIKSSRPWKVMVDPGAVSYGERTPEMPGEESWFHIIYSPLDADGVMKVRADLGVSFWNPESVVIAQPKEALWAINTEYHKLLRVINGGRFFAGHLNFFGVRRDDPWKTKQPLELCAENPCSSVIQKLGKCLAFGGYRADGSLLICFDDYPDVLRCARDGTVLNRWFSFEDFLFAEFYRLDRLFDTNGYLLGDVTTSAPAPDEQAK